ncbi:MAG: glycosyltransferase [Rhizomicrobium sp.]
MARSANILPVQPAGDHPLIFVTVGTTMPFDELLEEVDRLAAEDALGEQVVCQSGESKYRMTRGKQFRSLPSIDNIIAESSIVITHGGATVIQLLTARKPFVAFPNPRGAGDHQSSFLAKIASVSDISWDRNVKNLDRLIRERRLLGPARISTNIPRAGDVVLDVLGIGKNMGR